MFYGLIKDDKPRLGNTTLDQNAPSINSVPAPPSTVTPQLISYEDFRDLIAERSVAYLRAAVFLAQQDDCDYLLTRPLLAELLSHASQIEELLDSYGAKNNCRWARFRSLTAAIKLFSNVSYELLHIQHAIPHYRLLPVAQDFNKATDRAIRFIEKILQDATRRLIEEARRLGLPIQDRSDCDEFYIEKLPAGRLPHDLAVRKVDAVQQTISMLATSFLNLAAESKQALPKKPIEPQEFASLTTSPVSEEKLRSLELRFHNLQSLYDTYVSTTEVEVLDVDLPVLRGHISVVLHLLRTAKDIAHYYERHMSPLALQISQGRKRLVEPEQLLELLVNYSIFFVFQYLTCAELLCQNMLRRYTEISQIEVRVPPYRGFHVRPSTLIAKLVLHYGSEVKMRLGEEEYDASSTLDLFRANEKINAYKRRWLAAEIERLNLVPPDAKTDDPEGFIRKVILTLAEYSKLIIYEHPLQINTRMLPQDMQLVEMVSYEIARLQALGKIDIATDLKVTFIGDKRVLADIQTLAESGYGEDNFGNNIPLPEKLAFLRR